MWKKTLSSIKDLFLQTKLQIINIFTIISFLIIIFLPKIIT